jgi:flavin reductase (DIM6/NTAB) family NADH-FMN oxidoreductase RutF
LLLEELMEKINIGVFEFAEQAIRVFNRLGLLLVSTNEKTGPNVMTVGWGLAGVLWGRPVFVVFVRPSRHTYQVLEEADDFTLNIPAKGMEEQVSICGTVSGRAINKFKEAGLEILLSRRVNSPVIRQCIAHLECSIIYRTPLNGEKIPSLVKSSYSGNDYHKAYFGEMLEAYADQDYKSKLP